jgi:hypothetical protein
MSAIIDNNAIHAFVEVPNPEGVYSAQYVAYFRALGKRRRILLLSFAPKAAGTFFRQAAMEALRGYMPRLTHAQGGRDGVPHLPAFIVAYLDSGTPEIVGHIHMQAHRANRHFIDMFGLKPVIMLRSIPDMLASYWDMLEVDPVARADGLNCLIPRDFVSMSRDEKADFMIDVVAPWYASYFATWKDFSDEAPETVCVLSYAAFASDPAASLHRAIAHAGFATPRATCEAAVEMVWNKRENLRFNKGVGGRGRDYFSPDRVARLARQLSHYKQLASWMGELLGDVAEPAIRLAS